VEAGDLASTADLLLLGGERAGAIDAYRRRIAEAPDDLSSWSGLALAHRHLPEPASAALTTAPENVRSLHQAVLAESGAAPDAVDIATWMAAAPPR
jgi:hypothetical protein